MTNADDTSSANGLRLFQKQYRGTKNVCGADERLVPKLGHPIGERECGWMGELMRRGVIHSSSGFWKGDDHVTAHSIYTGLNPNARETRIWEPDGELDQIVKQVSVPAILNIYKVEGNFVEKKLGQEGCRSSEIWKRVEATVAIADEIHGEKELLHDTVIIGELEMLAVMCCGARTAGTIDYCDCSWKALQLVHLISVKIVGSDIEGGAGKELLKTYFVRVEES